MRNALIRYCGAHARRGAVALPFSAALKELKHRLQHDKGLSSTRKQLLLRECRQFAAIELAAKGGRDVSAAHLSSSSSLSSLTNVARTLRSVDACQFFSSRSNGSLYHSLQRIAEFIASTGECGDLHVPLPFGYDHVTPSTGLQRAELVLQHTKTTLSLSNERMASVMALTFGRHSQDVTRDADKLSLGFSRRMMIDEEGEGEEASLFPRTRGGEEDPAATIFTSSEVVELIRWCAWHVRTAVNGLQCNEPSALLNGIEFAVTLMEQFLCIDVDSVMQCGAVETTEEELELSDLAYAVVDRVLKLLYSSKAALRKCRATVLVDDNVSDTANEFSDGGVVAWRGLRISEDAQHALLCSQREHWQRALSLVVRALQWNEWLDSKGGDDDAPPVMEGKMENKENKEELGDDETLRVFLATPRLLRQTVKYILAQHGQWSLCNKLWRDTVHQRPQSPLSSPAAAELSSLSPFAALHHPSNIDNIITALAYVNARPSLSSTAAGMEGTKTTLDLQAKLLRLLLCLGIVPHRSISAAEFAALLRHSFRIPLGLGPVEGILSPSFVWRHAAMYPRRVRAALCLLCFQVVVRSGLTYTLELEDLYVVTTVLRQFLQGQHRGVLRASTASPTSRKGSNTNTTTNNNKEEEKRNYGDDEDEEESALGFLLVTFAAATRRTTTMPTTTTVGTTAEAHIIALTEVFVTCREELLPLKIKKSTAMMMDDGEEERVEVVKQEERDGMIRQGKKCMNPPLDTTITTATTTTTTSTAEWSMKMKNNNRKRNKSAVMLSLLSRELMTLLTMTPYRNSIGMTWRAALCAISNEVQRDGLDSHSVCAVEYLAQAMTKKVLEPDNTQLLEPLLRLAPYLSPFTVSKIIQSPVRRLLTWEQSLKLLPCTLWASDMQRHLLRRIAQERDTNDLPSVRGLMQAATVPRRLLQSSPTFITDMRMLTILTERNWCRALEAYTKSSSRVQWACAPHVMKLAILADVWHSPNGRNREALQPLLYVAVRAIGGERVAEEVLHTSLQRGMWSTGLAFHQFLQTEQPELIRKNSRIDVYGALLCKGLLSQSALTRTIAEVLKWSRRGKWAEASEAFMRYTGECSMTPSMYPPKEKEEKDDNSIVGTSSRHHGVALFPASVPSSLADFAHTVRYSMLCCTHMWEHALALFPPHTLPLPLHHSLHLQSLRGVMVVNSFLAEGCGTMMGASVTQPGENVIAETGVSGCSLSLPTSPLSSPSSMSLVQIALQEKLHRRRASTTKSSVESVEHSLRFLQKCGQWEQAMVVCEHALANRCFPHSASAILLSTCASSWEASLSCFSHLTERLRPDAMTMSLALKACMQGHQWVLALRILRQNMLTSTTPAPRVVNYAVKAMLLSGAWPAALRVVRQYHGTMSPFLANTIMQVYVESKCWNDAVEYFYECVKRGMRPLDESLAMAITASQAVSAEYRDAARVVSAIASVLEDFCHMHGVVLEHVIIVHREMMMSAAAAGSVVHTDLHFSLASPAFPASASIMTPAAH